MNDVRQWEAFGFEFPQADEEWPAGTVKILVDTKNPRIAVSKETVDMVNAAFKEAASCREK